MLAGACERPHERCAGWTHVHDSSIVRPTAGRRIRGVDRDSSPVLSRRREKCTVVPLGVDVERSARGADDAVTALRGRRLPAAASRPVVLFVGRLRYYKGLGVLMRALQQVSEAVLLLVVGDGRMRASWEALARHLHPPQRVVFAGKGTTSCRRATGWPTCSCCQPR